MLRTHYAAVVSSGRIIPVFVMGPIFFVLRPATGYSSGQAVSGPYRRRDSRFVILPSEHSRA